MVRGGVDDVGEVWITGFREWSRDTDDDGIGLGESIEVVGRLKPGGGISPITLSGICLM